MSVVSLVGVHKSYGTWPVLQGVDLMVPDGARIGIIGRTAPASPRLLRIVGGTEDVNEGEVVRRRGVTASYLEQNPEGDARTAEAWVLAGRPDVAALDDELRSIEAELARPAVTADLAKMDRVLTRSSRPRSVAGSRREDPGSRGGEEPADPSRLRRPRPHAPDARRSPAVSGSSPRSPRA